MINDNLIIEISEKTYLELKEHLNEIDNSLDKVIAHAIFIANEEGWYY